MSIADYPILGRLVDEEDSDETQEDINKDSLLIADQFQLIKCISKRVSKYELDFLLDEVKDNSSQEVWLEVMKAIIAAYSLNSLKPFLSPSFSTIDIKEESIQVLKFIKITLVNSIENKELNIDADRIDLEDFFKSKNAPQTLLFAIRLIDNDSLTRFKKKIFNEITLDFED